VPFRSVGIGLSAPARPGPQGSIEARRIELALHREALAGHGGQSAAVSFDCEKQPTGAPAMTLIAQPKARRWRRSRPWRRLPPAIA